MEKATSQLLLEPDWMSTMAICDSIRGGDTPPKYAVAAIKKKFYHENPHVQLYGLQVQLSFISLLGDYDVSPTCLYKPRPLGNGVRGEELRSTCSSGNGNDAVHGGDEGIGEAIQRRKGQREGARADTDVGHGIQRLPEVQYRHGKTYDYLTAFIFYISGTALFPSKDMYLLSALNCATTNVRLRYLKAVQP